MIRSNQDPCLRFTKITLLCLNLFYSGCYFKKKKQTTIISSYLATCHVLSPIHGITWQFYCKERKLNKPKRYFFRHYQKKTCRRGWLLLLINRYTQKSKRGACVIVSFPRTTKKVALGLFGHAGAVIIREEISDFFPPRDRKLQFRAASAERWEESRTYFARTSPFREVQWTGPSVRTVDARSLKVDIMIVLIGSYHQHE